MTLLYFERIRLNSSPMSLNYGRSRCCRRVCMRYRRNGRNILQSCARRMNPMMSPMTSLMMSLMMKSYLSCRHFPNLIPSLFVLNEVCQPFFYPFISQKNSGGLKTAGEDYSIRVFTNKSKMNLHSTLSTSKISLLNYDVRLLISSSAALYVLIPYLF